MRLISAASIVFILAIALALSGVTPAAQSGPGAGAAEEARSRRQQEGRATFRFDTFGDEQLWTNVLRMHEVIPTIDPATALAVGLKVDVEALPASVIEALAAGAVDLSDPAVTLALLQLDAVIGVKGTVNETGQLTSVGVTCALCHSSVDDSFAPGIGRRMDGWANTDLNVGAIVALSPALDAATKAEFRAWGPGKYDPRHHAFDGISIIPLNSPSVPIVIPPIYGLDGVQFETFTGDGPIAYWNSYVGVGQMGGQGNFRDPRIGLFITQRQDRVTPTLRTLLEYQLSLRAPTLAQGLDRSAVDRGEALFRGSARCATCHRGPAFTDVTKGPNPRTPLLHHPSETGMDRSYAERSATGRYRTTPLRGLLQHPPYFHDGSAADLPAVVQHYDRFFGLGLRPADQADLVEFLKTL
jgi:hypothetical protein